MTFGVSKFFGGGAGATLTAGGDVESQVTAKLVATLDKLRLDFNAAAANLQSALQVVATTGHAIQAGSVEISAATGAIVEQAVAAMGEVERSSHEIGSIIGVLDEIAFQTNLLALNAGIEAARAGEAGRGFAVVATKVRALAQRSANAAQEIKSLIALSGQQVSSGVGRVGNAGQALARIAQQVAKIDGVIGDIAAIAQQQAAGLAEVNIAVNQMEQNDAMVEETAAVSEQMANEGATVVRLISGGPEPKAAFKRKPQLKVLSNAGDQTGVAAITAVKQERAWAAF